MTRETLKLLHDAIVKDDLKSFKTVVRSNSDLSFCYGRFPVLSLLYLYGSTRILSSYEKFMLGLSNYTLVDEFSEDYIKFKDVAGRAVRLFSEETVHPILMLSVLGDSENIAKYYKKLYKNGEITAKMQKIYSLTHDEDIEISVSKFVAKKNKLPVIKKVFLCLVICVFCLMLAVPISCLSYVAGKNGFGTNSLPIKIDSEAEFIEAIQRGKRSYVLTGDITLSKPVSAEKFSGTIDGNRHRLTLSSEQKNSLMETLSGEVLNLKILADLDNLEIVKNVGLIATTLSGKISGCEVEATANVKFLTDTDTYFSLFAVTNDGTISNSKASGNVFAENNSNQNAFLVGFAGINNGEIANCVSDEGTFETDTVDLAGIAIDNNGKISGCENKLNLSQSSDKLWHPNTSGIVVNNYGEVANVVNRGEISSASTNDVIKNDDNQNGFVVYAAGIACANLNSITGAKNYGKITASSHRSTLYVGGIAATSSIHSENNTEGTIENSKAFGEISATISDANFLDDEVQAVVYAGGICGEAYCGLSFCGFEGTISVQTEGEKFAGGLAGMAYTMFTADGRLLLPISNCYASTAYNFDDYKGGLVGCINVGSPNYLTIIFTNCHYVRNSSTAYSGHYRVIYRFDDETFYSEITQIDDGSGITSHDSLEALKKNAGGLNFDD